MGTPGSGKTCAIIKLIKILEKRKMRVLLISFTNQAVDNVLIRLKEEGFNQFVRITNNLNSVDPKIRENVKTK